MNKVRGLVHTGLLGVMFAAASIVGCASGDSGSGQQGDNLTGDAVNPQCPGGGPDQSGAAKSFSARAVAVSVRVDIQNPSTTSWDGTAVLTDTKALPSSGGSVTKSAATVNGGAVAQAGAANAAARGKGGEASSTAAVTNASLFHTAPDGFLKEILGEDGRGGTVAINLQDLLESLGINDELLAVIFTGPLAGGIQADVIQEDAKSWCDAQGKAHSSAEAVLANLVVGGTPIPITLGPNQKILDLPGLVTITLNEQTTTGDGGASSIDATALHVNILDGKIDVKVARAQAGVVCASGGGGGSCPKR
ncbi:choice-of-anchor P family protein [Pendulispora albinea]|uniref:Uncharacterized protein n=1 Tax=Pendulispora albinea TaxID=2741071 RepID=A0ABZ2LUY7_9BACT